MAHAIPGPPLIDMRALATDPAGPAAVACVAAIDAAARDVGFFVAVGHGIEAEMGSVFAAARGFFDLPQPDKERTPRLDRYGFVPHASTSIDTARQSDNTEYLDIGMADEVPLPELPGFERSVRSYQRVAVRVSAVLLQALATGLGTDADFFARRMEAPQCRLRFLHYPTVEPGPDGTLPVPTAPHTDYGAITLLATDGVPGLEVKPLEADWTPVSAPAGSLVVNLGDMLARWSNDVYRSTPHRVVGPESGDRISIPFFVNPDPATIVAPIAECVSVDRPNRYEPVTAGAFLARRIDGSTEPYVDPTEGPARRHPEVRT